MNAVIDFLNTVFRGYALTVSWAGMLAMVIWGAMQTAAAVFNTANASMGLMATINLIAIVLLSGTVAKLTKGYFAQRRRGDEPRFHGGDYPELVNEVDTEIWYRE